MEAKALAKNVHIAPRKARSVVDMVRGKYVDEALDILSFTHKVASPVISKLIRSAIANAQYQDSAIDESDLYIKKIFVDEGFTRKWTRPRARGRADRILRRRAHITVIVDEKFEFDEK